MTVRAALVVLLLLAVCAARGAHAQACSAPDLAAIQGNTNCLQCLAGAGPLGTCPTFPQCQAFLVGPPQAISTSCLACIGAGEQAGQTASQIVATCTTTPTPAPTPPPTPAPPHVVLPICAVSSTTETAAPAPLICTSPAAGGGASPHVYFVSAHSFGVLSVLSGAVVRQATWESVGLAGVPQQACTTDTDSSTFYVWLRTAPNTFLPLGLDMTALQPVVTGLHVQSADFATDALLAAAYHPQRRSVMTTTANVTSTLYANTALLLEFSTVTLLTQPYLTLQNTFIEGSLFDGSNSRGTSVVVLGDGTVIVMLTGYANRLRASTGVWDANPSHISYFGLPGNPLLRRQTGFHGTVDATPNHFGEVTQQACGNAKYNMLSFAYRTRYFDTLLGMVVENTAEAAHIFANGLFVTEKYVVTAPRPNEYGGECKWDREESSLFRTLYTRFDNGTTQTETRRYSITPGIDATQNPPPNTPYFQVEVLGRTTSHSLAVARTTASRPMAARSMPASSFAAPMRMITFPDAPQAALPFISMRNVRSHPQRAAAREATALPKPHDGRLVVYFTDATSDRILFTGGVGPPPALTAFDIFYEGAPQCCSSSDDCQNGGHCNTQTRQCECCTGFVGALCEARACTAAACGAHGACNDVHGVCVCAPGWAGALW